MELLRIMAMFFIVVFHCSYKSGFTFDQLDANTFGVKCFWMLGELGVNLFTLISGYFQINGSFKSEKLIRMLGQVLFYWGLSVLVAFNLGILEISGVRNAILLLFPTLTNRYWYFTAFVILYIFSPWINSFLKSLTKKQFTHLLLISLIIWCVIPTFFGMMNGQVESMLFYTRLIWLAIMYAIGAYVRIVMPKFLQTIRPSILITAVSAALLAASIILIAQHPIFFAKVGITEWAYFWPPNTVLIFSLSLGVFGLFLNSQPFSSKAINRIASTTLGIYLFHDGILQGYLWKQLIGAAALQHEPYLIPYILSAAILVFAAGVIFDLARQCLERITLCRFLSSNAWLALKGCAACWTSSVTEKIINGSSTAGQRKNDDPPQVSFNFCVLVPAHHIRHP